MAPTRKNDDESPTRRKAAAKPAAKGPRASAGKPGPDTAKARAAKASKPARKAGESKAPDAPVAEGKASAPKAAARAQRAVRKTAKPAEAPAPQPPREPHKSAKDLAGVSPAPVPDRATLPGSTRTAGRPASPAAAPAAPAAPAKSSTPGATAPAAPAGPDPRGPTIPAAWGATPPSLARAIPPLPDEGDDPEPYDPPADNAGDGPGTDGPGAGDAEEEGWDEASPEAVDEAIHLLEQVRSGRQHVSALGRLSDAQVAALVQHYRVPVRPGANRHETLHQVLQGRGPGAGQEPVPQEDIAVEGLLELHPDGYGFLRRQKLGYAAHPLDVYVSVALVRKVGLKAGHHVSGHAHHPRPSEPLLALHKVLEVNHEDPARLASLTPFEKLTVVYPDERYTLEARPEDVEMRLIDLFCPLGRGQRGLIVAPPRSGKTVILQKIADSIARNHPHADIVVLLVDERPEEVTNMRRSVRGEVIASTFDKPVANHVRVAELAIEKVKRMVEMGRHVVMLLDSITRLGRAYNNLAPTSGRILSGGMDAGALTKPKNFFAAARNVEGGGSLTILATALVDTGSRLDQLVFEEFKGSGNMEVVLDRDLANQRIWPAINIPASGTRNEDLLLHPDELRRINRLRRALGDHTPADAMMMLKDLMKDHETNAALLLSVQ